MPPESARAFYEWLKDINFDFRVNKDFLSRLNFGVFGLGAAIYGKNFGKAVSKVFIKSTATNITTTDASTSTTTYTGILLNTQKI